MFTRLGLSGRPPHFSVEFYPYASLTNTIRIREDLALVRLSDALHGASMAVLEAAAALLLASVYRRKPPMNLNSLYRRYIYSRAVRRRFAAIRKQRARRASRHPSGDRHDLAQIFARLNRRYFGGNLPRPQLGWSERPWNRQLGICDPSLPVILVNARLDRPDVPRYAVEYVMFHEMLHLKHPQRLARCRLQSHSAEFRREERQFPHYERAVRILERLV